MSIKKLKAVSLGTAFFLKCNLLSAILFTLILMFQISESQAQVLKEIGKEFYVNKVEFENNNFFNKSVLESEITTKQNSYLFSHSIKPGLWSYYFIDFILPDWMFSQYDLKKFKSYLLNNFGEPPAKFNYITFQDDIVYLKSYYGYFGFFEAQVDTSVGIDNNWVNIKFKVNEGIRSKLTSVEYNFPPNFPSEKAENIIKESIIETESGYSVFDIKNERDRIVNQLLDFGFSFTTSDSIVVVSDSSNYPNIGLNFNINPSLLSNVSTQNMYINTLNEDDSTKVPDTFKIFPVNINVNSTDLNELDPEILIRHTELESGQIYTPSKRIASLRNLGELGVFRSADLRIDSVIIGSNNTYNVFPRYELALSPKHEIRPEIRLDSKSSGSFGLDLIYINNNTFHSAENMRFKIGGSVQIPQQLNFWGGSAKTQEWSFDSGVDFTFPYFLGTNNKSQISLKAQRAKKSTYTYTNITVGLKLEYKHSTITRSYFDLWELNWVDASTEYFDKILTGNNVNRPYLNSIFRWSIQRNDTDPILKNYGSSREFTFEESGLIPRLVAKGFKSANATQDSSTGQIWGLDYYQYSKFQTDLRWYFQTSPTVITATKVFLGYMVPYGVSSKTPPLSRFIVGGPTSLRGWFPASVGPGGFQTNNLNGYADIKIEGSLEYRKSWGQSWGTSFFIDYGNVWSSSGVGAFKLDQFYKEIAVDYGIGIKYFLPIGPVRFDFAWKAYDPSLKEENRFVVKKFRFNEVWDRISIYFGIGHAF